MVLRSSRSGKSPKSEQGIPSLFARIISREQELKVAVADSRAKAEERIESARKQRVRISSSVREATEKEAEKLLLQVGREAREEAVRLVRRGEEEAVLVLKEGRERLPAIIGDLLDIILPGQNHGGRS